jgi:hypothetical protein
VKLTSYAARPLTRVSGAKDTSSFPPIVDVEKLRAIGYGAALNVSGSCTSLFFGVSKFLHADEILSEKEDIGELAKLYLKDTKTQDVINRATFGIIMSDMSTAWRYLGKDRIVEADKVYIRDTDGGHKESIEHLAAQNEAAAAAIISRFNAETAKKSADEPDSETRKNQIKWLGSLSLDEKRTLAIHALAKVDEEHQKVSRVLLKLHSVVTGKPAPEADMEIVHKQIMEKLPSSLRNQVRDSREYVDPSRQSLADEFCDSWKRNSHPLRQDVKQIREERPEVFEPIYYRMGACTECFENVPRAYTRPWLAARRETEMQQQAKA